MRIELSKIDAEKATISLRVAVTVISPMAKSQTPFAIA